MSTLFGNVLPAVLLVFAGLAAAPAAAQTSRLPFPDLQLGSGTARVWAVAPLPDGGLLVGGEFTAINGAERSGIARLNADGSFDDAWSANVSGHVFTIAVSGDYAYLGGSFTASEDGVTRSNMARVSIAEGTLSPGWAAETFGAVRSFAVSGSELIVGGSFSDINGLTRLGLARVSLADGAVSAWTNDVTGSVASLALDGDNLYVAGLFDSIAGAGRTGLARVSATASNSADPGWVVSTGDATLAMRAVAVFGPHVYVGGDFDTLGGVPRRNLARVSTAAGAALDASWTPSVGGTLAALLVDSAGVLVAGAFDVDGPMRMGLAELDLATGAQTAWRPASRSRAFQNGASLALAGGHVLAGLYNDAVVDSESSIVRVPRGGSGVPDGAFRVYANAGSTQTYAIAHAADGRTYVGGSFQGVNGLAARNLLRIDAAGDLDAAWRPDPDSTVRALAMAGGDLIVGGEFTTIAGIARGNIAKFKTSTDSSIDAAWDPSPDGAVSRLAVDGSSVFVAGFFSTISGATRIRIAKLSTLGAGAADSGWNAGWLGPVDVHALAVGGGAVYAAGDFGASNTGQANLVKLSASSGARDAAWTPIPERPSEGAGGWDLALQGTSLFVTGNFGRIGGIQQRSIAKLDAVSGAVDPSWMPQVENARNVAVQDGVVYVGYVDRVDGVDFAQGPVALSAASGRPDFSWRPEDQYHPWTVRTRPDEVWFGLSFGTTSGDGAIAFPAAFCTGKPDGTPCDVDPPMSGTACAASICTPPYSATSVTLQISRNPASTGMPVRITATVNAASGTPAGRVDFFGSDGARIAMADVSGGGIAEETVDATANLTQIVAIFTGTSAHAPSRSTPLAVTVTDGAAAYDFTSDGRPDILFRNSASGATYIWEMNGTALATDRYMAGVDPSWTLAGVGDLDGDGRNDIVWTNLATGATYAWHMDGATLVSDAFLFALDPGWKIEAIADFEGSGRPSFLLRHAPSGVGMLRRSTSPGAFVDDPLYAIDNEWKVEAVGDFDRDGYPDFFFRNMTSGLGFVWYWNGAQLGASRTMFSIDPAWEVAQIADWNGDGNVDFLFRNAATGVVFIWYTDGISMQGSDFLFQVDPSWEIVPRH